MWNRILAIFVSESPSASLTGFVFGAIPYILLSWLRLNQKPDRNVLESVSGLYTLKPTRTILELQICIQFRFGRGRRRDTRFRDFHLCRPDNPVENELSELIIPPILMVMPTGKSEPTPAIWTFDTPSQVLGFTLCHRCTDMRIAAMRSIGSFKR